MNELEAMIVGVYLCLFNRCHMPISHRKLIIFATSIVMLLLDWAAADNDWKKIEGRDVQPLAQDYSVVFEAPDEHLYTAAASLSRLPSGRLLTSYALFTRVGKKSGHPDLEIETVFSTSGDRGATWTQVGSVPLGDGIPFHHRGRLYFLCNGRGRQNIFLVSSGDEGATWGEPVTLFEGRFWNTFTPYVVRGDTLYWALGASNAAGDFNRRGSRTVVVAGDLTSADLMKRTAWRISSDLIYPGTPEGLTAKLYPPTAPDRGDHWLEPNILEINGRLRVFLRLRLDGQATAHMCAVAEVHDDREKIAYEFTQFHPMPGAQGYFYITRDPCTGYFWTVVNLPTNSQDVAWGRELNARGFLGNPGNERRILMLLYSLDALNWFQAGCVARWKTPLRGFQYAALLVDGNDLLMTSRTAKNRPNQHDNDLITFHRIRNFRRLALNLRPGVR